MAESHSCSSVHHRTTIANANKNADRNADADADAATILRDLRKSTVQSSQSALFVDSASSSASSSASASAAAITPASHVCATLASEQTQADCDLSFLFDELQELFVKTDTVDADATNVSNDANETATACESAIATSIATPIAAAAASANANASLTSSKLTDSNAQQATQIEGIGFTNSNSNSVQAAVSLLQAQAQAHSVRPSKILYLGASKQYSTKAPAIRSTHANANATAHKIAIGKAKASAVHSSQSQISASTTGGTASLAGAKRRRSVSKQPKSTFAQTTNKALQSCRMSLSASAPAVHVQSTLDSSLGLNMIDSSNTEMLAYGNDFDAASASASAGVDFSAGADFSADGVDGSSGSVIEDKTHRTIREPAVFKHYFPPRWDAAEDDKPTVRINLTEAELDALMGKYGGETSSLFLDAAGMRIAESFDSREWEPAASVFVEAAKRHPSYNNVIRGEPTGGSRRSLLFALRRGDMIQDFEDTVYTHYATQAADHASASASASASACATTSTFDPILAAEEHLQKLRDHSLKRRAFRKPVRASVAVISDAAIVPGATQYEATATADEIESNYPYDDPYVCYTHDQHGCQESVLV